MFIKQTPFLSSGFYVLFILFIVLTSDQGFGEERHTTITADNLEYRAETGTYVATGNVVIERGGTTVHADEVLYTEESSETLATGSVMYIDSETTISAAKAKIYLDSKTGTLYDADVFYKRDNYHLQGEVIEKRGDKVYHSTNSSFTTCDAPVPAWCFKGREVDTVLEDKITVRKATFHIKDIPVFYTPYIWTSLVTERQTGFLMPTIGSSDSRGNEVRLPIYWAISDNMDATFVLDHFEKRGIGTGIEYRYMGLGGIKSDWWLYHIRDTSLKQDFYEVNALHEQRSPGKTGGFLSINYINEKDYYREYGFGRDMRIRRSLESAGEIAVPLTDSRIYLLSQYRVDLKADTADTPQKLPEIGYTLNSTRVGNFLLSANVNASNIWKDNGVSARRFDIYPKLMHSVGEDIVLTQEAGFRETLYYYYNKPDTHRDSLQRTAFEYDVTAQTRFFKKYASFTHIVEPSLRYHFISSSENDIGVFDSTELYGKTSSLELGLLNRGIVKGSDIFAVRIVQAMDTNDSDRPFLPLRLEASMKSPLVMKFESTYNPYDKKLDTLSYEIGSKVLKADLFIGQRYARKDNNLFFYAGAGFSPHQYLQVNAQAWYDAKGAGLRDLAVTVRYKRQCWGIKFESVKSPDDTTFKVMFELAGLGTGKK